jgi:hypothetical protein
MCAICLKNRPGVFGEHTEHGICLCASSRVAVYILDAHNNSLNTINFEPSHNPCNRMQQKKLLLDSRHNSKYSQKLTPCSLEETKLCHFFFKSASILCTLQLE